jgi:hypothetical protein
MPKRSFMAIVGGDLNSNLERQKSKAKVRHSFLLFLAPCSWVHPEARGRCSLGERCFVGGTGAVREGAGKTEAAKLSGAGIGPKHSAQENARQKRGRLTELGENREDVLADGTTGEILGSSELQASVKCDHARRTVTAQTDA